MIFELKFKRETSEINSANKLTSSRSSFGFEYPMCPNWNRPVPLYATRNLPYFPCNLTKNLPNIVGYYRFCIYRFCVYHIPVHTRTSNSLFFLFCDNSKKFVWYIFFILQLFTWRCREGLEEEVGSASNYKIIISSPSLPPFFFNANNGTWENY